MVHILTKRKMPDLLSFLEYFGERVEKFHENFLVEIISAAFLKDK